jgi:putative Mg2+ transporter-C (MgtC) family protein
LSLQLEGELAIRLLVALILGGVIGLEREYHRHPAGLRTLAMFSVGSCIFTLLGTSFGSHNTDPTRIAAQVASGVGFLGAGAILRQGTNVHGLTTAASIWVAAAIGVAVGFGLYLLPAACTLLVVLWLVALKPIETKLFGKYRERAATLPAGAPLDELGK